MVNGRFASVITPCGVNGSRPVADALVALIGIDVSSNGVAVNNDARLTAT